MIKYIIYNLLSLLNLHNLDLPRWMGGSKRAYRRLPLLIKVEEPPIL